ITTAGAELRHRHYWWTLPWGQDGARILPAANFEKYSAEMRKLRATFDEKVAGFIADYPTLKLAAKKSLNGLYNEQDYPTNIKAKFGIDLSILPLPESDVAEIKANIRAELEASTTAAMREPYERLYEHISRMVDRLSDPDG